MIEQHAAPEERGPDARPGPIMIELDSSYESAEALRWAIQARLARCFPPE